MSAATKRKAESGDINPQVPKRARFTLRKPIDMARQSLESEDDGEKSSHTQMPPGYQKHVITTPEKLAISYSYSPAHVADNPPPEHPADFHPVARPDVIEKGNDSPESLSESEDVLGLDGMAVDVSYEVAVPTSASLDPGAFDDIPLANVEQVVQSSASDVDKYFNDSAPEPTPAERASQIVQLKVASLAVWRNGRGPAPDFPNQGGIQKMLEIQRLLHEIRQVLAILERVHQGHADASKANPTQLDSIEKARADIKAFEIIYSTRPTFGNFDAMKAWAAEISSLSSKCETLATSFSGVCREMAYHLAVDLLFKELGLLTNAVIAVNKTICDDHWVIYNVGPWLASMANMGEMQKLQRDDSPARKCDSCKCPLWERDGCLFDASFENGAAHLCLACKLDKAFELDKWTPLLDVNESTFTDYVLKAHAAHGANFHRDLALRNVCMKACSKYLGKELHL